MKLPAPILRLFLLAAWTLSALAADPNWLAEFDSIAARGMRDGNVPGAAVGVIQNGRVVFAKGYGVRDLTSKQPVTPGTLFGMGSVTKSFTAAVVASVIDQGRLEWDKPVREYLPWFRMYDPIATEMITVRDMLTHRSGLPRHDFIRFSTHLTREELVRRIRHLEPNRTFRDVYQYNNLMFVTAGYLAGALAGASWEDLVKERLFVPIGMTRSNTSTRDSRQSDDLAKPHSAGRETDFYYYQEFGVGPNGAVNSCADDMLKYLQMWLDNGKAGGKQIISPEQMAELKRPVSVSTPTSSYAPGWQVGFHRGQRRISHGGAITGFRAHVTLLPDQRAGIVTMINAENSLADLLASYLADYVVGLTPEDYLGSTRRGSGGRSEVRPGPVPDTKPSKPLADYSGSYFHPAYGVVRVQADGEGLQIAFDALSLRMKHFHYDTFQTSQGLARFTLDDKGQVREMHLPLEPAVKPFVFVKR